MTNFVSCGVGGIEGGQGYDCTGQYREPDPKITGDVARVQLCIRHRTESFFDASVGSAVSMDVPVCRFCPAKAADEALKNK